MEELETQLIQMKTALLVASEDDKPALESIIKDLEDLIQSCGSVNTLNDDKGKSNCDTLSQKERNLDDKELDEYSKFQAEIAALENIDSETNDSSSKDPSAACSSRSSVQLASDENEESMNGISDELAALEGMKCMAPHEESWGQIGYYPAMISQVVPSSSDRDSDEELMNSMDSIMVRVVFLQPVVKSQLFCPFFKEDRCRFSDDECRFSHGEVVRLSNLREYKEPDYSKIVPGARILAKHSDDLWYKATVSRLTNEGICEVQYDKNKDVFELAMHETVPLEESSNDLTSDSEGLDDDSDEITEEASNSSASISSSFAAQDIMKMTATESLGDWEKYTKGFGSKLMAKMGYIMGTGLGRQSEGRVNPVDAVIVPQGMSLDKWMNMKEKVGGDKNWFTVEKRLKRAQKKHAHKETQQAEHRKNNSSSVFDFMNSKLSIRKNTTTKPKNDHSMEKINKQTSSNLNKKMLHIGENMKKVCKDIRKVKESMKRLEGRDPSTLSRMKEKLEALEKERHDLNQAENRIANEQKNRSDKKKLTEF